MQQDMEQAPVGHLFFQCAAPPQQRRSYDILPNDEFNVGRKTVHQALGAKDSSISTHHLRFHCVAYNDDNQDQVAPMVYVRVLSKRAVTLRRRKNMILDEQRVIQRSDGAIFLMHGDSLRLSRRVVLVFERAQHHQVSPSHKHDRNRRLEMSHFDDRYNITGEVLGFGASAKVYLAERRCDQKQLACKIIPTKQHHPDQSSFRRLTNSQDRSELTERSTRRLKNTMSREFRILKALRHPNIIALEKVFCAPCNTYIFQELITSGDLTSYVEQVGVLKEPQAAVIVIQVLEAVRYLHANCVVHRDIKPENILMTSWRDGARVVLTDFGQARVIPDLSETTNGVNVFRMKTLVGTFGYTAPEVYMHLNEDVEAAEGYSKAIDLWSVGSVTTVLLTNTFLLTDGHDTLAPRHMANQMEHNIARLDSQPEWIAISDVAKSFVKGCLTTDDRLRLTAKQALRHQWFRDKAYVKELNAAYQRAISNWRPKENVIDMIEYLQYPETILPPKSNAPAETRSRHFAPSLEFPVPRLNLKGLQRTHTPLPAIGEESLVSLPLPRTSLDLGTSSLPRSST